MAQIASTSPVQTIIDEKTSSVLEDETREALVECARLGDDLAFADLYTQYQKPLRNRLAHLLNNDWEAVNELTQDTFLSAWQNLPGLRPPFNFEGWLYRIAANKALDFLRRKKRIEFVALPEYESLSDCYFQIESFSAPGHEDFVCEVEWLKQTLEQMPHQQKVCLLLQEQWGFSQREIAEFLQIGEKCVSAYISRGHQWLRKARAASFSDPFIIQKKRKGGKIR